MCLRITEGDSTKREKYKKNMTDEEEGNVNIMIKELCLIDRRDNVCQKLTANFTTILFR